MVSASMGATPPWAFFQNRASNMGFARLGWGTMGDSFRLCNRQALGERMITLDCDVLQADGGTRTASITGAYVALVDAVSAAEARTLKRDPVIGAVAPSRSASTRAHRCSTSTTRRIPRCDTDMNVVMNDGGGFIEVQGTAEGHAFRRDDDALLGLAEKSIRRTDRQQREALAE